MKLRSNESPTFSSSNVVKKEFKISASAKAFKILSSNLYKNKIRAIVRELSTNALDAHIANGNSERPFDITLPTSLENTFIIRDYGIGLTKEQVFELYTTYFESTKADSNDYVGALGLGSKSPFSYADSFMVTSFKDGVQTIYEMSIHNGIPQVAELAEFETTEENGLQIAIAVNTKDINRFYEEASYVYKTFSVKPNFIGKSVTVSFSEVSDHGSYFITKDNWTHPCGLYALMGNIAYPIAQHMYSKTSLTSFTHNNVVCIKFELGSLDITPSREELSYDPDTENVILEAIKNIDLVIVKDLLEIYKDVKCPRQAYKQISNSHTHSVREIVYKQFMIDGLSINEWKRELYWDNKISCGKRIRYRRLQITQAKGINLTYRGKNSWDVDNLADIAKESLTLFLNDDKKQVLKTLQGLANTGKITNGSNVYVFNTYNEEEKEIAENLIKKWKYGKLTVLVNSVVGPDARKHVQTVPKSKGSLVNSEKLVLDEDGSITSVKTQYYSEDVKNYTGYYAFKFFECFVNENEDTVICEQTIREYMKYKQIEEVLIVRKQHWKRMIENTKAIPVHMEAAEEIENISGRQVAIRRPAVSTHYSSWITTLHTVIGSEVTKLLLPKRKKSKHSAYDFVLAANNDGPFQRQLSKDGMKQIDAFEGKRAAIRHAEYVTIEKLNDKYETIRIMVSNMSTRNLVEHKNTILKFINVIG